jgi:hypothetical protein
LKTLAKLALIIALLAVILGLIFLQIEISNLQSSTQTKKPESTPIPTTNSTPSPTQNVSPDVIADINATPTSGYINGVPQSQYLIINGTVTNDGPSTAYNVGLKVTAVGGAHLGVPLNVINVIIPTTSGTYTTGKSYALSTLAPHQNVSINITIVPSYEPAPMIESPIVTVVWGNAP